MRPYDSVILNVDLPQYNIKAGTVGAIVETLSEADGAYLVEFFDKDHQTIDVVDVTAAQITVTLPDYFEGEQVALMTDLPHHNLRRGQVGRIKKRTAPGTYLVVFQDYHEQIYAQLTLHASQLMLLRWQPNKQSA
jgi:hypothetical protein